MTLAVIWGSAFVLMSAALDSFTPVGIIFARMFVAAIAMALLSLALRIRFPARRYWGRIAVMALVAVVVPGTVQCFALAYLSSALVGILMSLTPLTTFLIVVLFYREDRPSFWRVVGLFVGVLGIAVVIGIWKPIGTATAWGFVLALAAPLSFSASIPYARRHLTVREASDELSPLAITTAMFAFAAVLTAPLLPFIGLQSGPMTASAAACVGTIALVGSALGYALNLRLIRISDVTTASTVMYLVPVVSVVAGAIVLREAITWNEVVGGAVILSGAALAQGLIRPPSRRPSRSTALQG